MKRLIGILVVSALVLSGCSVNTTPDWVSNGKSGDYPSNQYLTAMAEGDNEADAGEKARIQIEKVFRARFDRKYLDTLALGKITIDGKVQNLHAKRAEEIVTDRLGKLMNGIRIAETWVNPKTRRAYALAVLPRAQAAVKLNEELYTLDRATNAFLGQVNRKSDPLDKIQLTAQAIDTQVARRSLTRTLMEVDRRGKATPPRWRLGKLSASLDGLLLQVRVSQQVEQDPTKRLDRSLVDALTIAGFYIDSSKRPEFIMRGTLELNDGGERDGWRWMNATVEVKMVESRTSRNRGKVRWSIQAAGKTEEQARQRIIAKIDSLLKSEMRGTVVKFATN